MADRITDERLREMANGATIYGHERNAIAAELLAARNKIRADEEHLPTIGRLTQDLYETEQELDAARARIAKLEQEPPMAMIDFGYGLDLQGIRDDLKFLDDVRKQNQELRAEVERLRARVGWLDHLDTAEGRAMHASEVLRVASEQLRADLREAVGLLRELSRPDHEEDLDARYVAFLEKHEETNQ